MNYVVGFVFEKNPVTAVWEVLLIRKTRPSWQAGLLNGVGGKIELLEASSEAMVREFQEETGVRTTVDQWRNVTSIRISPELPFRAFPSPSYVHFFRYDEHGSAVLNNFHHLVRATTDEIPEWLDVELIGARTDLIRNLQTLIPMAFHGGFEPAFILQDGPYHDRT